MNGRLGRQLHAIGWKSLGQEAQSKLLLCLLANLSVAIAGRPALRLPRPPAGTGHLLLDGGQTGSAREAAFHNAALMHARTQDDFHPLGNLHIATVVLPALLAEGELGSSQGAVRGEAFLDALATGYAAATGLSRRFSALNTPRGLRSTCLYSGMGAAVAVARLRGQDAQGVGNTLGLASQSGFGTTQCWRDGSDEYQLHVANGASRLRSDAAMNALERVLILADHFNPKFGRPDMDPRILRALNLVGEWISRPVSVGDLSRASGLSRSQFTALFTRQMRIGPQAYVEKLKLERASQMLRSPRWTIGQVAAAHGFANVFYFSTRFRKQFGLSPSSYRRRHSQDPRDTGMTL